MQFNFRLLNGSRLVEVYYDASGKPSGYRSPAFPPEPHSSEFYSEVEEELRDQEHGDVFLFPEHLPAVFAAEDLDRNLSPQVIQPTEDRLSRDQLIAKKVKEYSEEVTKAWEEAKALPPLTEDDFPIA